jgi:hypothetical protein
MTSNTGAKFQFMPTAASSVAVAFAMSKAVFGDLCSRAERHRAGEMRHSRAVAEPIDLCATLEYNAGSSHDRNHTHPAVLLHTINRCNTVKKADTVAKPLRERFQKLKTVVTTYVTLLKMQKLFYRDPLFHIGPTAGCPRPVALLPAANQRHVRLQFACK